MGILGRVKGGVVVFDDSDALPEGTVVRVERVEESEEPPAAESLGEMLRGLAGIAKGLPPDLARNHDHYLHGRPKK